MRSYCSLNYKFKCRSRLDPLYLSKQQLLSINVLLKLLRLLGYKYNYCLYFDNLIFCKSAALFYCQWNHCLISKVI